MIRSEALFETLSVCRVFLRWYRPLVLEIFARINALEFSAGSFKRSFVSGNKRGVLTDMQSNPGNHDYVCQAGVIKVMEARFC